MTGMEHRQSDLEPVGLVGPGRMGLALAQRLKACGRKVIVYRRRNTSRTEQWISAGGAIADSISGLGDCPAVMLSLPTSDDVRSIAQSLLAVLRPGALILDASTIHPSAARECAMLAQRYGVTWLDTPVSGGPAGAANGTLAIMAGGSPDGFERARPLLADLGKTIANLGNSGAGLICKLANNLLLAVSALATCETLSLAAKAGLRPQATLGMWRAGSGYNKFMDARAQALAQFGAFEPAQFTVSMLLKDLRVAMDACAEIGFTPDSLRPTLEAFERAEAMGLGEHDFSAVLRVVEARAGVAVA